MASPATGRAGHSSAERCSTSVLLRMGPKAGGRWLSRPPRGFSRGTTVRARLGDTHRRVDHPRLRTSCSPSPPTVWPPKSLNRSTRLNRSKRALEGDATAALRAGQGEKEGLALGGLRKDARQTETSERL